MEEFKMTRKLLNGAAIPNHGDVRTLESTPSAKLSTTFKLKILEQLPVYVPTPQKILKMVFKL